MNPARSTITFLFDVDNTLLDNDRVIAHVKQWGPVALLTDGDVVFQPRKVDRSGLFDAVAGQVLISLHKEQELDDVAQRCPAEHYVMVEDKLRLLTAIKSIWGRRVTTVFVRQGHYALDPNILSDYPAPDIGVERIGDLLDYELPDFTSSAIAHQEKDIS